MKAGQMLLPLLAACVACSPEDARKPEPPTAPTHSYATQVRAPTPNYPALLKLPNLPMASGVMREATSPPPIGATLIGKMWIARLAERKALLGYGLAGKSSDGPVSIIDTGLTAQDFDAWTRAQGWQVPTHIRWSFVPALNLPPVSDAAKAGIRVWPAATARTGAQNAAALLGRVELRDGCFFTGLNGQPVDKLAWFHAEIGLDKDKSGYFIFKNRLSGQTLARVGEDLFWGGPASAEIDPAARAALRAACGPHEVYVVGSPQSRERMYIQYPHLRAPGA